MRCGRDSEYVDIAALHTDTLKLTFKLSDIYFYRETGYLDKDTPTNTNHNIDPLD